MLETEFNNCSHDLSYGPQDTKKDIVKRLSLHDTPFELRQIYAYNSEVRQALVFMLPLLIWFSRCSWLARIF